MKKLNYILTIVFLMLASLMLSACEKSEFVLTENDDNSADITAKNAAKDSSVMVGTLEIAEGEQVVFTPDLPKGRIKVDIIPTDQEQSIDKLPKMDGEPVLSVEIKGIDQTFHTIPAGSYMVKASVLEKADGTVHIELKPVK